MLQREIDPAIRLPTSRSSRSMLERYLDRRPRRGRLPRLPPEQRHLRPAPGRPQPDGAGQDPLRRRSRPTSSTCSPTSPTTYSRGWGHITTRQNIQFHFVQLERVPAVLRDLASVGLTTREACGDTVRNVQGCHLAGACPYEVLDISAWAEAAFRHFLRNPLAQRLPRKFKINFSGCETDCGQAMFNDVGVIAVTRTPDDGTVEPGFRVFVAGGLGANPHPALALEEFTAREDLLPTIEAILRVFDHNGNRDNKLRARMKWLVDTLGWDELQRQVLKERKFLLGLVVLARWHPRRASRSSATRRPAPPTASTPTADRPGHARVSVDPHATPTTAGRSANVVRGVAKGTVSAYAWAQARRHHLRPVPGARLDPARARRRGAGHQPPELRVPRPHRGAAAHAVRAPRPPSAWPSPVPSSPATSSPAPAPTPATSPSPSPAASPTPSAPRLEEEGLAEVGGVRTNISGCTNSCGQHHIADIGFFGAERRAHGKSAPGYQMLLGGYVGQEQIHFGEKALRLPAKNAPEAAVRVVRRFADEREAGESLPRLARPRPVARRRGRRACSDLDEFPTPEEAPDFYVDYGETGPYVAETGESECAT